MMETWRVARPGPKLVFSDTNCVVDFGKCAVDFAEVCCVEYENVCEIFYEMISCLRKIPQEQWVAMKHDAMID